MVDVEKGTAEYNEIKTSIDQTHRGTMKNLLKVFSYLTHLTYYPFMHGMSVCPS